MNVVDVIKGQLTSVVMQKLASLLGVSEPKTSSAIGAAVPGLLASLASMISSSGGAEKLASSINDFDTDSQDSPGDWLTKQPQESLDQGGSLLGGLLSGNAVSGLSESLSSFSGIGAGNSKKLLGYLAPMVLGTVAKQFTGGEATSQGLQNFFADQKSNIAGAMPAGFAMTDEVEATVSRAKEPERADTGTVRLESRRDQTTASSRSEGSMWKTLVPIAALAIGALFVAQYLNRQGDNAEVPAAIAEVSESDETHTMMRPAIEESPISIPDTDKFTAEFSSVYTDATETLGSIKDAESAEAALPELTKLSDRVATLSAMTDALPDVAKQSIAKISGDNFGEIKTIIDTILVIPGVEPILGPILDGITTKLDMFNQLTQ